MSNFISTVIGDPKNASPARKFTVYALLGTLAAFLIAVIILIASSVVFAVKGDEAPVAEDENSGGEGGGSYVSSGVVTYDTLDSIDALDAKVKQDEIVKIGDVRTKLSTGTAHHYYAKKSGEENLTRATAKALDKMMIAFYENNKNALVVDTKNAECNIPLIEKTSSDGYSFNMIRFHDDATVYNNTTYKWIYDNAYTYGFVYTENTFTYVGVAIASHIRTTSSIVDYAQFLNMIKGVKTNMSTTVRDTANNKSISYQMYYLSADASEFKVPTNYEYTVMLDGTNGYVIVVNMSKPIAVEAQNTQGGEG